MTRRTIAALAGVAVLLTACGNTADDTAAPADTPTASTTDQEQPGNGSDESTPTDAATTTAVDVKDFTYVPEAITVSVGATVTWTNQDKFSHTVTQGSPDDPGEFEGKLGERDSFEAKGLTTEWTFDESGTYQYYCRYHPNMRGTVIVTNG